MLRPAYRRLLLAGAILLPLAGPAQAETLRDALLRAYRDNPTITAQRASQRANDENVPIARSQGLPSANANAAYDNNLYTNNPFLTAPRQLSAQGQISVPIYQGGAVRNGVRAAETRVEAGQAQLRGTEADLFTAVVSAYMNVVRDEAIVGLNTQNVRVLDVNLQASRDRFQVGDLTRTDVAQSEARLALARAQLQSAQAQLISSRENYIAVTGAPPVDLQDPPVLPNLPASPGAAVDVAMRENPTLIAAAKQRDATRYDVRVAAANRLPRLAATFGGSYSRVFGADTGGASIAQSSTAATAGLTATLPLFQGGRPAAQVRQAEALRSQAIENVTAAERTVISQARSAFAIWQSSEQVIKSSETAVNANKLSLEGVRAENSVGTRTILDILNAEQELLNSQVTLVTAQRDAYVAGFALLAAMGNAEARDLGLDGGPLYDPTENYKRVRGKIWDFGGDGEPQPIAASTAATPAQTAIVTKPLDPILDTPVDRNPALTTGSAAPSRR